MTSLAFDRVLIWAALAHLGVGLVCVVAMWTGAAPILGVSPALKPMKFGLSIAIYLATMAMLVPALSMAARAKQLIAWVLVLTMLVEMLAIVLQALRGTTSHFNHRGPFDTLVWRVMVFAIVLATITMIAIAVLATVRPLVGPDGPWSPVARVAWCAGLWLFLFAAVSGFSMGGRLQHSVGGVDGGPGIPLVNWSTSHGDLRVPHFIGVHGLQSLPLLAAGITWLRLPGLVTWTILGAGILLHVFLALGTLIQAYAGKAVH